ncbi:MAG: hypothetical protein LBO72_07335 [Helicobacteraceae bacterium]|jgi:hypothetical protein|nr:hypothetical protein [Helicobacteraceae bacterium]
MRIADARVIFANNYPKLHGQKAAKLLAIEPLKIPEELNDKFREYDARNANHEYYPLAAGEYLLLVFLGDLKIPFTTLRKRTADNEDFYMSKIGDFFKIEIEKKDAKNE